jgi:hypothetical protein
MRISVLLIDKSGDSLRPGIEDGPGEIIEKNICNVCGKEFVKFIRDAIRAGE